MTTNQTSETEVDERAGESDGGASRRGLIKAGALAAVAGVAGGLATSRSTAAADGDPILVGTMNEGTLETEVAAGGFSSYGPDDYLGLYGGSQGDEGIGVWGGSDTGIGVYGGSGFVGVAGDGVAADFIALGSGRVAMRPAGSITPTSAGTVGTLAVTADGTLWFCTATNRWTELGGRNGSGSFHAINPVRAYDSRMPSPSPGTIRSGQSRLVSVADGRNPLTGAVTAANAVPAGAKAVTYNLAVVDTVAAGYLAVVPGSANSATTASINWPSPNYGAIANGSLSQVDASRRVRVFCMGGPTHFIIDITGYFR